MSMYNGFKIHLNGTIVKQPSSFAISRYNLTKSGRVASGDMTMDLVAKKRKFFFTYDVISARDMEQILAAIDGDSMFFNISYVENGVSKGATVYAGEINQDKFRTPDQVSTKSWYWKNFTFNLIEK